MSARWENKFPCLQVRVSHPLERYLQHLCKGWRPCKAAGQGGPDDRELPFYRQVKNTTGATVAEGIFVAGLSIQAAYIKNEFQNRWSVVTKREVLLAEKGVQLLLRPNLVSPWVRGSGHGAPRQSVRFQGRRAELENTGLELREDSNDRDRGTDTQTRDKEDRFKRIAISHYRLSIGKTAPSVWQLYELAIRMRHGKTAAKTYKVLRAMSSMQIQVCYRHMQSLSSVDRRILDSHFRLARPQGSSLRDLGLSSWEVNARSSRVLVCICVARY